MSGNKVYNDKPKEIGTDKVTKSGNLEKGSKTKEIKQEPSTKNSTGKGPKKG